MGLLGSMDAKLVGKVLIWSATFNKDINQNLAQNLVNTKFASMQFDRSAVNASNHKDSIFL